MFIILFRKINKIPDFYMIFARKIFLPEFYGGTCPSLPPSPAPMLKLRTILAVVCRDFRPMTHKLTQYNICGAGFCHVCHANLVPVSSATRFWRAKNWRSARDWNDEFYFWLSVNINNAIIVKTAAASSMSALHSAMFVFIFGARNVLARRIWNGKPAPVIMRRFIHPPVVNDLSAGFPRLLGSAGFFFLKILGPGKSWKSKVKLMENPGKISLKFMYFSSGSTGKQVAAVV